MIRVNKAAEIPPSLCSENCNHYDGQDVQETLVSDHHGKCYLCEQDPGKDFEIEHLKPKALGYFPELEFEWGNLFLVCGYCNGRKPNSSEIIDPSVNNVEDIIIHQIDLNSKSVEFRSNPSHLNVQNTIELLSKLFNGKSQIRNIREQMLYEDLQREITFFLEKLDHYKSDKNIDSRQIIIDLLHISKEFLGFKYWIIKDSGFYDEFKEIMIWNKTA